jgi:hypothetical protein
VPSPLSPPMSILGTHTVTQNTPPNNLNNSRKSGAPSTSYHRHPCDPGDKFHVRLQFTVFNQSSVKAAQGNPRKRRSPRGVSQSARPHGKDVQAMGWDGASGALILVFSWQVALDHCSVVCVHASLRGCQASCVREAMLTTPRIGKLRKPAFGKATACSREMK